VDCVAEYAHPGTGERPAGAYVNAKITNLRDRRRAHRTFYSFGGQLLKTIVVEALSALRGGGQTYLRQLFENIPHEWAGKYRVVAILPLKLADQLTSGLPIEVLTPEFAARSLVHRVLWYWIKLPRLLKDLRADVLFCPGGTLPTRRLHNARSVVAHRNTLPFDVVERTRYPYGYLRAKFWLLRYVQGASFRDADLVIFVSEYGRFVVDHCISRRHGDSISIPHGLSDHFRRRRERSPEKIGEQDYVLYVSILDFYKAQLQVVSAWAKLRQRRTTHEKLVFVGPENSDYGQRVRDLILSLGLQDEVRIIGDVPHEALPSYYQNAKLNLFASSCENCPNILLEAMAGGRPVLCSSYPPMPEFAGDASTYFDPYDPDQLADLLERFLDDEALCERMGAAALTRSLRYQWSDTARKTWSALAELAG